MKEGLSRRGIVIAFALSLGIFFFLGRPLWEHPFDIDANVWWSYAAIPPIVGALLWLERKLTAWSFFIDTLAVLLLKFATTYVIAATVWVLSDGPPKRAPLSFPAAPARSAPDYQKVDPAGPSVSGVVLDGGKPRPGVLVYVERGVDAVYEPPGAPVRLDNSGAGFLPQVAALQVHQPLELTSSDGRLHTAQGRPEAGGAPVNYPAVPGKREAVRFEQALGLVVLRCQVHAAGSEAPAVIAVLSHPFHAVTDDAGQFTLAGVPRAVLGLRAAGADLRSARLDVDARAAVPAIELHLPVR